jgi:hypothetical protein
MSDLITWLRAQLDADERNLQAGLNEYLDTRLENDFRFRLAELDAKRRILDLHFRSDFPYDPDDGPGDYSWTARCNRCHEPEPCTEQRLLALPYADREGYRDEWRPS